MSNQQNTQPIAWAINARSHLIHIRDAVRGRTDMKCPACGQPLIVKQGRIQTWHFAHRATDTPRHCSRESVLHHAAKRLVVEAARDGRTLQGADILEPAQGADWLGQRVSVGRGTEPKSLVMRNGVNERAIGQGLLVADALVDLADGNSLAVEICVTHAKSEEDARVFAELNLPALEINLSEYRDDWDLTLNDLRELVLETAPRRWVWSSKQDACLAEARMALAAELERRNSQLRLWARRHRPDDHTLTTLPAVSFFRQAHSACGRITALARSARCLASLTDDWQPMDRGWRRAGLADDGTCVEIRFGFPGIQEEASRLRPVFVMTLTQSGLAREGWYHTELAWPLEAKAQAELTQRIARYRLEESLLEAFPEADQDRLDALCHALALDSPEHPDSVTVPGWPATEVTWRTAAWVYLVIHEKATITAASLQDWLVRLFRSPAGNQTNIPQRVMEDWLAEMVEAKHLTPDGSGEYRVTLPRQFRKARPWEPGGGVTHINIPLPASVSVV